MESDGDLYITTLRQIEEAEFSGCEYRTARRLLDLAHPETGTVRLDAEVAYWLCGVTSWGAVRRMLGALQAMDLIRYRAGREAWAGISVEFVAWDAIRMPAVIHFGSPVIQNGSRSDTDSIAVACPACQTVIEIGSPVIQNGSPTPDEAESVIQNGSRVINNGSPVIQNGSPPHTRVVSQLVSYDPPDPDLEEETNELTNCRDPAEQTFEPPKMPMPDALEAARSFALLIDPTVVGLDAVAARSLAQLYPFEHILRHVCSYRRQLDAGMVKGPGALLNRIRAGFGGAVSTDADRQEEWFCRHCPELALPDPNNTEGRASPYVAGYEDIMIYQPRPPHD